MYRCISMWNTNAFPSALHGILMKNVGQVSFCTLAFDGMSFISEAFFQEILIGLDFSVISTTVCASSQPTETALVVRLGQ